MDEYQQEEHVLYAVEEQIAWHTVGVVHGSGNEKWQGIATGCAIHWNGHFLILTADHVVRDTDPKDLRFFFRAPGTLDRAQREEILQAKGVATNQLLPFGKIQIGNVIQSRKFDLAAIPVNPRIEDRKLIQFFKLASGGNTPIQGSPLVIMGFPFDISRLTTNDERVVFSSFEWTEVGRIQTNLDSKFDPDHHFLS